jgi:hypothetical protein
LDNKPLSESFLEAAEDWVDKENAAKFLEETKSAVMAQRQAQLGDMPVNKAEQTVKASPSWYSHLEKVCDARREANLAWVKVEYLKMKFNEWQSHEANNRTAARL